MYEIFLKLSIKPFLFCHFFVSFRNFAEIDFKEYTYYIYLSVELKHCNNEPPAIFGRFDHRNKLRSS